MYKIGLAKKEAEELTNEMRNNFSSQKQFFKQDEASRVPGDFKAEKNAKKNLLPIEEYRLNSKKPKFSKDMQVEDDRDEKIKNSQTLLKYLMKEADKLYKTADDNQSKLDMYQVSAFDL